MKCVQAGEKENGAILIIGNDATATTVCDNGHTQNVNIPCFKHEILFEIGIHAIKDGYYREAISTFSASLERYYEFVIRLLLTEYNSESIDVAWKKISSQSERQLGAYIFCHFMTFGKAPDVIPPKLVQLRNDVVHKGYIPKEIDAINYGTKVAGLINEGYQKLKSTHGDQINEQMRRVMFPNPDETADKYQIIHTFLNIQRDTSRSSLHDYIDTVSTHNNRRF